MTDQNRCKICGDFGQRIEKMEEPIYYHCFKCDFIFMDEEFWMTPEEEKEFYYTHENTSDNEGYVNMFKKFLDKAVVPFQDEIESALDFGAGPGPVLAMLLEEIGIQTDIYDPYFAPKKVYQGKRYDLITSTEVFEHFSDPMVEIEQLNDHLNSGSYLAVMTLFHGGVENFPKWFYRRDPTHISFYSTRTFEWIAQYFGFKMIVLDEKNVCVLKK